MSQVGSLVIGGGVSFTEILATVVYDTYRVATPAVLKAMQEAGFRGEIRTSVPGNREAAKADAEAAGAAKATPEPRSP